MAGPKSVESRSRNLPPGKKIAPELAPRPSLEILEPKGRPQALYGTLRGAPGTGPGRPRSSMCQHNVDRNSIPSGDRNLDPICGSEPRTGTRELKESQRPGKESELGTRAVQGRSGVLVPRPGKFLEPFRFQRGS